MTRRVGLVLAFVCIAGAAFYADWNRHPDRRPWIFAQPGPPLELPVFLDLTDPAEQSRWYLGPGVTRDESASGGFLARASGETFHVSRRLGVAAGFLGTVIVHTRRPRRPVRLTPYIHRQAKPDYAAVAQIDADDPLRQVVHFRAGRWDRRAVEGFRLEPHRLDSAIDLTGIEITREKWSPITASTPGGVDWDGAFAESGRPTNVLMLMADTLRADRMSLYGYARETTPYLESLAEYGIVFETNRSQAACTFPSVNSLLTSQPASAFLRQPPDEFAPLGRYRPIAARLGKRGFETYAVSSSWVVRATESSHNNWGGGYDAGFDQFDETCAGLPAECVNRRAIDLIDAAEGAWFLYLHYLDPHAPYQPPAGSHERRFARPFHGDDDIEAGETGAPSRAIYRDQLPHGLSRRDLEHLGDLYDEEVRYLDGQLMQLFIALSERDLLKNTLIVFVSDHGEELLEHGHINHCRSVYDTEIRTPLVFWIPGVPRGTRVRHLAQNIDVVPTILDYAVGPTISGGLDLDLDLDLAGRSLRPAIELDRAINPITLSEQGPLRAVSDARYKLILDRRDRLSRLFDLERDPAEQKDLAPSHPEIVGRLQESLSDWDQDSDREALRRARETEENLRALGYIE